MKLPFTLGLVFLFSCTAALALDKADEDALKDTQGLLNDQKRLEELGKTDAEAGKALNQVKMLTQSDPKKQAELNAISSSIFANMVKSNNGDTITMQDQLQKALADPKAFMNGLSPEQQKRIRDLASEIDKQNTNMKK